MAIVTIRPTEADIGIANAIAAHTDVPTERTAEALTWGADEHLLMALATAWWTQRRAQRNAADHVLITTLVASAFPHLLKTVFVIMLAEQDDNITPAGVKGIGELGNVGTNAAVCNASFHATGQRLRKLPVRLEQLEL